MKLGIFMIKYLRWNALRRGTRLVIRSLRHESAIVEENPIACFIVDQSGTSGRIGISADASCQELTHIGAATTTLHYKQDHKIHSQCDFPDYMHATQGPHRQAWESIVTGRRNVIQDVWTCLESRRHEHFVAVRAHVRRGCQTGYQCVQISLNEYEDCSEMTVETRDTLVLQGAQVKFNPYSVPKAKSRETFVD
ncbi:hypothetical protein COOONC_10557 [Cooperia oncophora]